MEKSRKIAERVGYTGQEFYAFFHKKESFPSGCAKMLFPLGARRKAMQAHRLSLATTRQSFFATTQ